MWNGRAGLLIGENQVRKQFVLATRGFSHNEIWVAALPSYARLMCGVVFVRSLLGRSRGVASASG